MGMRYSLDKAEIMVQYQKLTDNELRPEHNIVKLIVANKFSTKLAYLF